MKYIVAGGRDFYNQNVVNRVLHTFSDIDEIVSGQAKGADGCGEMFALQNDIVLTRFQANWEDYGKAAGFIRNVEMGEYADACIAFWDGKSIGTKHMIYTMKKLGKPCFVYDYNGTRRNL